MKMHRISILSLFVACIWALIIGPTAEAKLNDRVVLRERIGWLSSTSEPTVDGAPIVAVLGISKLYERRGYEPAWTDPAMIEELFDQVLRSVEHGLDPEDFHARQLGVRLKAGPRANDPVFAADTEILCTDALARLAVTLHFGKLDPADLGPAWNLSRKIEAEDPVKVFNDALNKKNIAAALEETSPDTLFYRWLRRALVTYRGIMASGGWPQIPSGPVLEVGSSDLRVATLRTRLRATGDYSTPDPSDPQTFDEDLETAVKRFQERHGIDTDGKVGPRSIEELNIPVEARIDQIRASLERMRWVFREISGDFLIVDPSTVDWPATATKGFPYMIRQEPGPHNALGRVKFMFPNKYMVYLHDTPSKGHFARSERAFSHGCIRTENPFDLATLLLNDQGWDRARIDQVVASKKNTRVNLEEPLPVMILYWTAEANSDGTVFFRKDLYDRDAPIIEGLDEPFLVSPPKNARSAVETR